MKGDAAFFSGQGRGCLLDDILVVFSEPVLEKFVGNADGERAVLEGFLNRRGKPGQKALVVYLRTDFLLDVIPERVGVVFVVHGVVFCEKLPS